MRTTVEIDEDLAAKLRRLARERGVTFKEALNTILRAGFGARRDQRRPFKVDAWRMGVRPGVDVTKALQLAGALEDEEIIRKLEMRK